MGRSPLSLCAIARAMRTLAVVLVAGLAIAAVSGCESAPADESGSSQDPFPTGEGGGDGTVPDPTDTACETDADCLASSGDLAVCQAATCDASAGICITGPAPDGAPCENGDTCTEQDTCDNGACTAGTAVVCDDANPCTDDVCVPEAGCVHNPNGLECDDGDACTVGDKCADGACGGEPRVCDDENPCTVDSCDSGEGCLTEITPDIACDDDSQCTSDDTCTADGVCTGDEVPCDDGNPCTDDICDAASGCVYQDNTSPCSDGDACTTLDACTAGVCIGGPAPDCSDGDPCTTDTCDAETGCEHTPNSDPCDDGQVCTSDDVCTDGLCAGSPTECDDGNPCTFDGCDAGQGCVATPLVGIACDDGDACTSTDTCDAAGGCTGTTVVCDDGNDCTDDWCESETGCQATFNSDPCTDYSQCTTGDTCYEGNCVGQDVTCYDANPCTSDACDPDLGCAFAPDDTLTCLVAGSFQDDHPCMINDRCESGECTGDAVDCDDGNPCTKSWCSTSPGQEGCSVLPLDGTACNDDSVCTLGDTCDDAGDCVGAEISCDDQNPCTADSCDPVWGCQHLDLSAVGCDDGNWCTEGDMCLEGECISGPSGCECQSDVDCGVDTNLCDGVLYCDKLGQFGEKNKCQNDPTTIPPPCDQSSDGPCFRTECQPFTGLCAPTPLPGGECDDGDACTVADLCGVTEGGAAYCAGLLPLPCDDQEWCSVDSCDPETGCVFEFIEGKYCGENSACWEGAQCVEGACTKYGPLDCNDNNPCTLDSCHSVDGCINDLLVGSVCDDGDPCTIGDSCSDIGKCFGTPDLCNDNNPCTDDSCSYEGEGGCVNEFNNAPCDDGLAGTAGDTCGLEEEGVCAGTPIECDDGKLCTQDMWTANGCEFTLFQGPCDDGNACTPTSTCDDEGFCVGAALDPHDGDPCTIDSCLPATGLANEPVEGCSSCQVDGDCDAGWFCGEPPFNAAIGLPESKGICTEDFPDDWDTGKEGCQAEYYNDGEVCNCECGAIDPDCADPTNSVYGCSVLGQFCNAQGLCESPPPSCELYCGIITDTCVGVNAQYGNTDLCMIHCDAMAWEPGEDNADQVNTLGCRLNRAILAGATNEKSIHCAHSGPTGGGHCGTWCENYCDITGANCTGGNEIFGTAGACATACATYSDDGAVGDSIGDTVQCRAYYASVAIDPAAADTNCAYASEDGGGVCVDGVVEVPTCQAYCEKVAEACSSADSQYADIDECVTHCLQIAAWEPGLQGATTGNSIGCRSTMAQKALDTGDGLQYCPKAGPTGGGQCGSWCENYCQLADKQCGDDSDYSNKPMFTGGDNPEGSLACEAACSDFDTAGTPGDDTGDTVQCRLTYLGLPAYINPDIHCPHGDEGGGGVCTAEGDQAPTCSSYCADMAVACPMQFMMEDNCKKYCLLGASWPSGSKTDNASNTIGCRENAAELASLHCGGVDGNGDPQPSCSEEGTTIKEALCDVASPAGNSSEIAIAECGSWCENYCDLTLSDCESDYLAWYGDKATCIATCSGWSEDGTNGDSTGDTVQCRIQSLTMAAMNPQACAKAGPDSSTCTDAPEGVNCITYCQEVTTNCTDDYAQYSSSSENENGNMDDMCDGDGSGMPGMPGMPDMPGMDPCADDGGGMGGMEQSPYDSCFSTCNDMYNWAEGTEEDVEGNTLGCRQNHAGLAASCDPDGDPEAYAECMDLHCSAAGETGGDICGSECANHCDSSITKCAGADAQYASWDECMEICPTWPSDAPDGSQTGNSLQCRNYHLMNVMDLGPNNAQECASSGPDGGQTCVEAPADLVINEIDYAVSGADAYDFVELYNKGDGPADLSLYSIEVVLGPGGLVSMPIHSLGEAGAELPPKAYLVLSKQALLNQLDNSDTLVKVATHIDSVSDFLPSGYGAPPDSTPNGGAVRLMREEEDGSTTVVDAVSWVKAVPGAFEGWDCGNVDDDECFEWEDTGQGSLVRCLDGTDTDKNELDFIWLKTESPGESNPPCWMKNDNVCEDGSNGTVDKGEDCDNSPADCGECEEIPFECATFAEVQGILSNYNCVGCHTANPSLAVTGGVCEDDNAPCGGLILDTLEGIQAGGDNGPATVACDPSTSNLVLKLRSETKPFLSTMPHFTPSNPSPTPVTDADLDFISNWISQGATDTCDPNICPQP